MNAECLLNLIDARQESYSKSKKPLVVLRVLNSLFSIVLLNCIIQQGYFEGRCFNTWIRFCDLGIAVGVVAIVFCFHFTLADALMDRDRRKCMVIVDYLFSVIFAISNLFWFIYLRNKWICSETPYDTYRSNMLLAIVSCLMSVFSWTAHALYALHLVNVITPDREDPLPPVSGPVHYCNRVEPVRNFQDFTRLLYARHDVGFEFGYDYVCDKVKVEKRQEKADLPPPYALFAPPSYANVRCNVDKGSI